MVPEVRNKEVSQLLETDVSNVQSAKVTLFLKDTASKYLFIPSRQFCTSFIMWFPFVKIKSSKLKGWGG